LEKLYIDSGKEIRVVFCDISKAFDRVWHKGLLFKLKQSVISGNLFNWFKNYLSGRSQRVVINGSNSDWLSINAGVPQWFILDPLLFIIFINDSVHGIDAQIKLFADDTSLYLVVDDPIETVETLNGDLDKINIWSEKWLVKFNPQKTETMILSKKNNKPNHPPP
jgi:intein/homing endonuclease